MSMIEHTCEHGASRETGGLFLTTCTGCQAQEALSELTSAVYAIAHGGDAGPAGLEALAMSIAGAGNFGDHNLSDAVGGVGSEISEGLRDVAAGLHAIAAAIRERGAA